MRTLLKKFEQAFGNAAQVKNFGRSDHLMVEVESTRLVEAAAWLRMEESFRLDFLENASVFESKGRLYFTYFVRSFSNPHQLALRSNALVSDAFTAVEFPSLLRVWSQVEAFESEMEPLFGIQFSGRAQSRSHSKNFGSYEGFPMRKSFDWGEEVEI